MRLSKAVIAALLMALLCSMVIVSDGSDATVEIQQGSLIFTLNDDYTAEVSGYSGPGGEVVVPTSVIHENRSYSVTSVGPSAFMSSNISSVALPDSIRTIYSFAFMNCDKLVSVTLNEGLETIRSYAFYSCDQLASIHIPSSVRCIEQSTISGLMLDTITVSSLNMHYKVVDGVLFSKDGSRLITYPSMKGDIKYIVPPSVSSVDSFAFYGSMNLKELVFNEGLTHLHSPLQYCFLKTIYLPSTLTTIDNGLIMGSSDTIVLSEDNTSFVLVDGILYDSHMETVIEITVDAGTDIIIPEDVTVLGKFSADFLTIDAIDLPLTLEMISDGVFSNTQMLEITIPSSVQYFELSAFMNSGLENITFMGVPNHIGNCAFYVRSSVLTEYYAVKPVLLDDYVSYYTNIVYIPLGSELASVKGVTIGDLTYDLESNGTAKLVGFDTFHVDIPSSVSYNGHDYPVITIEPRLFEKSDIISVSIPSTIKTIEDVTFRSCRSLSSVDLGEGIEVLGTASFSHCTSLVSITLPSTLKVMDGQPFYRCESLESINISQSNQYFKVIDDVLFSKDGKILYCYPCAKTDVIYSLPSSVEMINGLAINDNRNLQHLILNEGLKYAEDAAITDCDHLSSIYVPSTAYNLEDSFASQCWDLKEIIVSDDNQWYTDIDGVFFSKDLSILIKYPSKRGVEEYKIPEGVVELADDAFGYAMLSSVTLPSTLRSIGEDCFWGSPIHGITIPASVTSIGDDAFTNTEVSVVTFEGVPDLIGSSAFGVHPSEITEYYNKQKVPLEDYCDGQTIFYIPLQSVDQFTVTFVAEGTVVYTEKVDSGTILGSMPDAPSIPGKEFDYWALNGNRFDPGTPITSDITLTAVYVVKDYPTVVAALSNLGNSVIVIVTDVENDATPSGVTVNVTFTVLQEVKAFGQVVLKPVPVQRTFSVMEEGLAVDHASYDLSTILGDNYSVISATAQIGDRNFGFMTLNFRGVE